MRTSVSFSVAILFSVFALLSFGSVAAEAAALVNINTADAALLETLVGIGPSKSTAIITFRNTHGPFARIEDIQNVSGIGPSTFAGIKAFITVGDTTTNTSGTASQTTASSTASNISTTTASTSSANAGANAAADSTTNTATGPSSGGPANYLPIPMLRIFAGGDRTVSSGADTAFSAVVYDGKNNKRDDAIVTWAFGDGMRSTGSSVYHAYVDPGEYIAVIHASTPDGGDAMTQVIIMVKDAGIKITSVSPRGITLMNNDSRTLDLSLWRLSSGGKEFKIPADTQILAGHSVLFPTRVIELPTADSAFLLYPSGEVAAAFPETAPDAPATVQPVVQPESSNIVQSDKTVTTIISPKANVQKNEEAVIAPAATPVSGAAAGATSLASSSLTSAKAAPVALPVASGIFHSPWTLSFLGVMTLAGGAFILL